MRIDRPPKPVSPLVLYSIVVVTAVLGLTTHMAKRATYTGDEPHYMLYALSLNAAGKPVMSEEQYEAFRVAPDRKIRLASYPIRDIQRGDTPKHALLLPMLLAPLARFPLQTIRLMSLAAGMAGLCFLVRLFLHQKLSTSAALASLVPPALFLPSWPYYFTALPEIFLFLLTSIAFQNLLAVPGTILRQFWPSLVCGCIAPFFHLRGIPLSLAVASYVAWRVVTNAQNSTIQWRSLFWVAIIYGVTAVVALFYNRAIYGSIFGSVTHARPGLTLGGLIAMLLNFRHGLFTYAPIYILSVAGLLAGLWRGERWALPAGIYLLGVVGLSMGPDPEECYPARFWVQAVPVLAICLMGFARGCIPVGPKAAIYLLVGAVSAANTVLFLVDPDLYMSARSSALPYDRMFELFPWWHGGFWVNLTGYAGYGFVALCFLLPCIGMAAWALITGNRLAIVLTIVLIGIGFEIHRARPVNTVVRNENGHLVIHADDERVLGRAPIRIELCAPYLVKCPGSSIVISGQDETWHGNQNSVHIIRPSLRWMTPFDLTVAKQTPAPSEIDPAAVRVAINNSWVVKLW